MALGYAQISFLSNVLPSVVSFLTMRQLGKWFDRVNPLFSWSVVRTGWGLDPIILASAPLFASPFVQLPFIIAMIARFSRGLVMGGVQILQFQIGVNYFARKHEDTSRYLGIQYGLGGIFRFLSPMIGAIVVSTWSRSGLLLISGIGVLLSAVHSWSQGQQERKAGRPDTFADFEHNSSCLNSKEII